MNILVVNPGSTSTKLALFAAGPEAAPHRLAEEELRHPKEALAAFARVVDQLPLRLAATRDFVDRCRLQPGEVAAVVGRGGLLRPVAGGVYRVDEAMCAELRQALHGEHASNLGALLARELAADWGVPALVVDPPVTDELTDLARLTGLPDIQRRSVFHALSQRGAARLVCTRLGQRYEDSGVVVAHLGGGISVGAHVRGRVVDVVNGLDGEGPYTPERTGGLPLLPLLHQVETGKATVVELRRTILSRGGLFAHLATADLLEVDRRITAGDLHAARILQGLAYNTAKHVAAMASVVCQSGPLLAVVLTGGMMRSQGLSCQLVQRVAFLGPVEVVVENMEMPALATGALAALAGTAAVQDYSLT